MRMRCWLLLESSSIRSPSNNAISGSSIATSIGPFLVRLGS